MSGGFVIIGGKNASSKPFKKILGSGKAEENAHGDVRRSHCAKNNSMTLHVGRGI